MKSAAVILAALVAGLVAGTASGSGGRASDTLSVSADAPQATPGSKGDRAPSAYASSLDAPASGADLRVELSGLPANAAPGEHFTVTFTATNDGPEAASDVALNVAISSEFDVDFGEVPPGVSCPTYPANGAHGGTILCDLGEIAAGSSKSFLWHVIAARAGSAQTTASLSGSISDPDPDDNSAVADTAVRLSNADLRVIKTATPSVTVGGDVTYSVSVTNLGPDPVLGGTLNDALPASLGAANAMPFLWTGPGSFCHMIGVGAGAPYLECLSAKLHCKIERALTPPLTLACTLGAFAPGESGFVQVIVKTTTPGTITNTATVTGSEIVEPSTANNNSSATTEVRALTPTVSCPASVSTTTDPGLATALVAPGTATASGGSPPVTVSSDGIPIGNAFPIGVTTITWAATDAAGQSASCTQTVTVVDDEAPAISCAAPDDDWHVTNVSLGCSATDVGFGLADPADAEFTLSTSVADDQTDPDASTGSRRVCDLAGNCAITGPVGGNKIDREGPAITVAFPAAGGTYVLGSSVAANFDCDDGAGSGLGNCSGPSVVATSIPGAHVFTVSAADAVGNVSVRTVQYTVVYAATCDGQPSRQVREPINADGTSVFKQGRTVPVAFAVCDASGQPTSTAGVVRSFSLVRTSAGTVSTDVNEEPQSTSADSSFRWDPIGLQWIYNLSTTKLAARKTYTYRISLDDGTSIDFSFGLR